ncbi:MAG: hypothetical protein NTY07_15030 [Bacteroidia bacterium]|nr:hypothetical protein [Bacteroidia bacterium]
METILIKLSPKANKSKLIEAIEMLKGVKNVTGVSGSIAEEEFIAKQMTVSRKSGKGNKQKVMEYLSK